MAAHRSRKNGTAPTRSGASAIPRRSRMRWCSLPPNGRPSLRAKSCVSMAASPSGALEVRDGAVDTGWVSAQSSAGMLTLDAGVGNLRQLELIDGERRISPLATAPWVAHAGADFPDDLAPVERNLSGDFFCAPFGASDVED